MRKVFHKTTHRLSIGIAKLLSRGRVRLNYVWVFVIVWAKVFYRIIPRPSIGIGKLPSKGVQQLNYVWVVVIMMVLAF